MHDRDDDRAEHAAREPGRGALDPVRELHRDDVAGTHAEAPEATGEPGREVEDVAEGAPPRAARGPDPHRYVRRGAQAALDQPSEAVVVPPPRSAVLVGERG